MTAKADGAGRQEWQPCRLCLIRGHIVAECLACKGAGWVKEEADRG